MSNGQRKIAEPRLLTKVPLDETTISEEQLEKILMPVRFRYYNGHITELHFAENDVAWSENLKRSVLNMLQLNLTPRNRDISEETNKHFVSTEVTFHFRKFQSSELPPLSNAHNFNNFRRQLRANARWLTPSTRTSRT